MAEFFFLRLAVTLFVAVAGTVVLPVFSSEVSLAFIPNRFSFFIPAGEPFNVTCVGSGDDAQTFSSFKWLNEEGRVIQEGVPGTQIEGQNSLTLTFTDKKKESGTYKCEALYRGNTLAKTLPIYFYDEIPAFEDTFEIVNATEDSFLNITCDALGELPMTYEWFDQNYEKITANSSRSFHAIESVLTIPRVNLNDSGMYTCLASNRHGMESKIFQLMVLPAIENDENEKASFRSASVVNITTTSVRFDFNVTGPVKYIQAEYFDDYTKDSFSYTVTFYGDDYEIINLAPAGNYSFKFRVHPSENDSWSKIYQVVLLPEKSEMLIRKINSGTVSLEWHLEHEGDVRNTVDKHELTYFTVSKEHFKNGWIRIGCPITIQIPQCASMSSYTVTGLNERDYYEFQLRAHTAGGYSEPYIQRI